MATYETNKQGNNLIPIQAKKYGVFAEKGLTVSFLTELYHVKPEL